MLKCRRASQNNVLLNIILNFIFVCKDDQWDHPRQVRPWKRITQPSNVWLGSATTNSDWWSRRRSKANAQKADKFREKKNHRVIVHGRIRRNKLDGHVRIFGKIPNEPLANCGVHKLVEEGLGFVGRYENGIPTGVCWRGNKSFKNLNKSAYATC